MCWWLGGTASVNLCIINSPYSKFIFYLCLIYKMCLSFILYVTVFMSIIQFNWLELVLNWDHICFFSREPIRKEALRHLTNILSSFCMAAETLQHNWRTLTEYEDLSHAFLCTDQWAGIINKLGCKRWLTAVKAKEGIQGYFLEYVYVWWFYIVLPEIYLTSSNIHLFQSPKLMYSVA